MLKKVLLASISLAALHASQSAQSPQPHQGMQQPASSSNCPPCEMGGKIGYVLIPANIGSPCDQPLQAPQHHDAAPMHHHGNVNPMHALPTKEQEELEEKLRPVEPHIYKKPDGQGEWGKALGSTVYFRKLGLWVKAEGVEHPRDIIHTHVDQKAQEVDNAEAAGRPTPPPPPRAGIKPAKKFPTVKPDALGTTQRVNPVKTEPTEGNKRNFALGAPNVAQTGVTGQAAPKIDIPAAPPPPPPPPPTPPNTPRRTGLPAVNAVAAGKPISTAPAGPSASADAIAR
ncbi:MAG: hypothetical protein FJX71_05520 [Alphaproteobacteria bacterium]|nr:hypothetical protein [Alphaproteobacteria bacterium]